MIKAIKMPDLGTTSDEILLTRWLKAESDTVSLGEPIFEVETDKATMEVESYIAGVIKKIIVSAGESVSVGTVLAYIGNPEDVFDAEPL